MTSRYEIIVCLRTLQQMTRTYNEAYFVAAHAFVSEVAGFLVSERTKFAFLMDKNEGMYAF